VDGRRGTTQGRRGVQTKESTKKRENINAIQIYIFNGKKYENKNSSRTKIQRRKKKIAWRVKINKQNLRKGQHVVSRHKVGKKRKLQSRR
jgi:hypothetical protein